MWESGKTLGTDRYGTATNSDLARRKGTGVRLKENGGFCVEFAEDTSYGTEGFKFKWEGTLGYGERC